MKIRRLIFGMRKGVRYATIVLTASLALGLSPALASSATAATSGATGSASETRSCLGFEAAQSAPGQPQASSDLRQAARSAAAAAQADPAWRAVADQLQYEASLPDAMLSAAQVAQAKTDSSAIQSSCAAIAVPSYSAQQAQAATAGPLNSNTATAWTYFTGNTSLTAVQVAGLEGNLMVESGLNPAIVQNGCSYPPGPCGVGIAQWTAPGGRFSSLENLASTEGTTWPTLSVQLQFVWNELTSNSGYGLAALQGCTTTACATQVVETKYERPANQSTTCSSNSKPSYCTRLADANELLAAYSQAAPASAVQIIRNPAGSGYWLLSAQGGVYSYGGAPFFGSAAGQSYFAGQRAVGMAADPAGTGYWIVSAAGGVYSYGSAPSYGAAAGQSYFAGQRAVGMAADPAGTGYWIVSAAGGVYSYGSAPSYGAAAGQSYFAGQTAVGMAADPAGTGYWIVSAAGGVYSYGSAPSYGAAAGQSYFAGQTAVGMAADPAGTGYWIVSAAGGVYSYGSAPSYGAAAGQSYFAGKTAAALADSADGGGYLIMSSDGGVYAYGNAVFSGGGV